MKVNARVIALSFCVALIATGCRGAGTGSSGIVSSLPTGHASFAIAVPPAAPGAAASMQSVVVTLTGVNGQAPSSSIAPERMNLTKSTPGCSLATGGTLNCTATIAVPGGSDTFTVVTYSQPNGAGTQVSASQVTTAITAGRSTNCVKKAPAGTPMSKTAQTGAKV